MSDVKSVGGLLLAGGSSSRMGRPKQLLPIGEQSLLSLAVEHALASKLDPVVVVLGHRADDVRKSLERYSDNPKLFIAINPAYREGMSESLKKGIEILQRYPVAGALILLGDQPRVTTAVIDRLVERFIESDKLICKPVYGKESGNPVLFGRSLFPDLLRVYGDQGGRDIVRAHSDEVLRVVFPDPQTGIDIDTPEAYQKYLQDLE